MRASAGPAPARARATCCSVRSSPARRSRRRWSPRRWASRRRAWRSRSRAISTWPARSASATRRSASRRSACASTSRRPMPPRSSSRRCARRPSVTASSCRPCASRRALLSAELDVVRLGEGEPVVLVHGSIVDARRTWRHQLELAERWTLVLPNRPGFAGSPPPARRDLWAEAPPIAEVLGDGAHLVGHSYGAVIALLAAALRPGAVRSLTVSEPGCLALAAGHPAADERLAHGIELYRAGTAMTAHEFLSLFRAAVHSSHATPDELPEWLDPRAPPVMAERPPWEAEIPLDALAAAPFPKLVISGAHDPAFEAVCDVLAEGIGARREVLPGRGHTIPALGVPYNALLEEHFRGAPVHP